MTKLLVPIAISLGIAASLVIPTMLSYLTAGCSGC